MSYIPFSQRLGYTEMPTTITRESLPENVMNSIQNIFCELWNKYCASYDVHDLLNYHFYRYYLNLRIEDSDCSIEPLSYIDDDHFEWYEKIDVIEWTIQFLYSNFNESDKSKLEHCVSELNKEFSRHRYGYRIVKGYFVETTSEDEINCITKAIDETNTNVSTHLRQAICSITPSNQVPDYRNSIKESISAVGSYLRDNFGGTTLGEAIKNLKKKNPNLINRFILEAIEKLYTYTNQSDTGIRHELLSQDYVPDHSDALFMLIQASSFVNYLTNKFVLSNE